MQQSRRQHQRRLQSHCQLLQHCSRASARVWQAMALRLSLMLFLLVHLQTSVS